MPAVPRSLLLASVLLLACGPAQAHFIWVLPSEGAPDKARIVFSDTPAPDENADLLKKIAHAEVFVRTSDRGKPAQLKPTLEGDALTVTVAGKGEREVGAVCTYGVVQRGKSEPFLLNYYARTLIGAKGASELAASAWDRLPLDLVEGKSGWVVLWQGKPLEGAEFVLFVPGQGEKIEGKTAANGIIPIPQTKKAGLFAVRVLHREAKEGEQGGKKYREVRHYATLTQQVAQAPAGSAEKPAAKADPEATKLLADARAARALYHGFPGFTADVEVNIDGKVARGRVDVSSKGKVELKLEADEAASQWARRTLASTIAHRLDSGSSESDTPCAFVDDDRDNPLGRAIRVLNDEFHSSYRIRDRQVIVVNRQMKDIRFTITVLENHQTADKKYLPACFVVNYWDAKTDALTNSEAHRQTWQRVGPYDLPHRTLVVTATTGKQKARSLTLTKCQLHK
jgi:hypothetical protein